MPSLRRVFMTFRVFLMFLWMCVWAFFWRAQQLRKYSRCQISSFSRYRSSQCLVPSLSPHPLSLFHPSHARSPTWMKMNGRRLILNYSHSKAPSTILWEWMRFNEMKQWISTRSSSLYSFLQGWNSSPRADLTIPAPPPPSQRQES